MEDFALKADRVVACVEPESGSEGPERTGLPLEFQGDQAAKKHMEEQLLRTQRLESIGMLASGIAHDLNNVLAPIILAAPELREHATRPDDLRIIMSLEKSAERGVALVRQILAFAQGVGGGRQLVDVRHILQETFNVIRETFPKNIRLEDDFQANLAPIMADPTQVHQVILNLCVNARDAMPSGGKLAIRAETCVLDERAAAAIEGASAGTWLVMEFEDTGTGIADETLSHIWEPFFTTKEAGRGTGIGLSTVRGIVEGHSGFITLKTRPGEGTIFRVHLPAADAKTDTNGPDPVLSKISPGKGELVLIVDDEAQIRDVTAAILKRHGYRVLVAGDGIEALAIFAPRSEEIGVVVTDLRMPNLDGSTLARVARRLNPSVKILAVSGLSSGGDAAQMKKIANAFLFKPFKAGALLQVLAGLLHPEAVAPAA